MHCTCVIGELNGVDGTDIKAQQLKQEGSIEKVIIMQSLKAAK